MILGGSFSFCAGGGAVNWWLKIEELLIRCRINASLLIAGALVNKDGALSMREIKEEAARTRENLKFSSSGLYPS